MDGKPEHSMPSASMTPEAEASIDATPDETQFQPNTFASIWLTLRPYALRIAASFYVAIVFGVNDGMFGILLPRIKAHYGINDAIVSILFLCNTAGYLSAAFINGLIVHRLGQPGALYLGAASQLLSYVLLLLAAPFPAMAVFMLFLGFGIALQDAGVNVVVAGVPYATTNLNMLHAFYGLGALFGPIIGSGLLAANLAWNVAYMILAGFAFVNTTALILVFRRVHLQNPPSATSPQSSPLTTAKSPANLLTQAFRLRVTYVGALFLLIYVGVEVTIGGWIYSFLTEIRHGDPVLMGSLVSLYWVGLTLGRVILGYVTGRFGEKLMITIYLFVIVASILVIWLVQVVVADAIVLFFVGAALGPLFPTTISIASKVVPQELFASSVGFLTAFGSGGAALFPWLTGTIAQNFGIWVMMPFCLALTIVMLVFWIFIPSPPRMNRRRKPEDRLSGSEGVVRVEDNQEGENKVV